MRLKVIGYSHLGETRPDGVRYVWQAGDRFPYIESAAFSTRAKIKTAAIDDSVSAYTTSVSSGCILTPGRLACKFCRTGQALRYSGPLSSSEIALQNTLMVLTDMENTQYPQVQNNLREFAYMGQGEPGFSYPQLRKAILITEQAMKQLGQKVYRHIVATCGVSDMVDALIADLENKYFGDQRITFHFSLHATRQRESIMPVTALYDYTQIIKKMVKIRDLTGEKPCVGVILFKNYCNGSLKNYSTDAAEIERVAALLDPDVCRISLCEFNQCDNVGVNEEVSPEEAEQLVTQLESKGFQVKLFASFGKKENTACGLLGGTEPSVPADNILLDRYTRACGLINSIE